MGFAIGQLASKPAAIFNLSAWALVNNINANKLYNKIVVTFGAGVYAINRSKSKLLKRTANTWTMVLERENAIPFINGVPVKLVPVPDVEKAELADEKVSKKDKKSKELESAETGPRTRIRIREEAEEREIKEEFICEHCESSFKTSHGLSIHMSKKHAD